MIIINIKSGSVNTLEESYYFAVTNWIGKCLLCLKTYHRHDTYERKTPRRFGPAAIQRVYCNNCGKSHALLPCFIIPYARVLDVVREAAIVGICFNSHTIEELAELMDVDPTTVARWWKIFRNKAGTLMKALTKELAQSPKLSDWTSGSLQTFEEGKKILELIGQCRATFSLNFPFCGFVCVNLLNPYLLFERKGMTD